MRDCVRAKVESDWLRKMTDAVFGGPRCTHTGGAFLHAYFLGYFSIAVVRHPCQKKPGEERVCFPSQGTVHQRESRQEPGGRGGHREARGMLLAGLLP